MNDPDHFLERWSRRKRLAGKEPDKLKPDSSKPDLPESDLPPSPAEVRATGAERNRSNAPSNAASARSAGAASEPAFDPASLPSLDSIGAQTDITGFLKAGVPSELRHAALRRAWSADPAIRDFKEMADYDWDFTVPNETMGFGDIDPDVDIKKMLADVFGDQPRPEVPTAEEMPPTEELTSASRELELPSERVALESPTEVPDESENSDRLPVENVAHDEMMQRNKNIATQDGATDTDDEPKKRRRAQGGALPQ